MNLHANKQQILAEVRLAEVFGAKDGSDGLTRFRAHLRDLFAKSKALPDSEFAAFYDVVWDALIEDLTLFESVLDSMRRNQNNGKLDLGFRSRN